MKQATLCVLLLFTTCYLGYSQGKLEKAEESLTKKEENRRNTSRSRSRDSFNSSDSEDSYLSDEFFGIFIELFLGITYYTTFESYWERDHRASYASITKYPYYNSKKGNYAYDWGDDTTVFGTTISNRFIVENQKLYGNHLNIDMRFLKRVGLEADYLQLWEDNTNFGDNSLAIFTAMAKYHRVRTERFDAWWGLGATYVDGEVKELGFTYGLGAELFFARPLSLEASFNQAFINGETVNTFNALLNYHYKRLTFSGGYEHLKIGDPDFSMFSVGVGVSF